MKKAELRLYSCLISPDIPKLLMLLGFHLMVCYIEMDHLFCFASYSLLICMPDFKMAVIHKHTSQ